MKPFMRPFLTSVAVLGLLCSNVVATRYPGTNQVKKERPLEISARDNNTLFFLPIKKSSAEALLPKGTSLLSSHPVPGFASDEWPMIFNPGLNQDVSLISTDFDRGYIGIGWTDKSKDGKTPFIYSFDVISSFNPPISLGGELLAWFKFRTVDWNPKAVDTPFQYDEKKKSYSFGAYKDQHVYFDLEYVKSDKDPLPRELYNQALTFGRWQHGGCLYHEQYYTFPGVDAHDIVANITIGNSWIDDSVAGTWKNVKGLRLTQNWIETISQACDKTAPTHGSL
ncbi:unnamed protein product [Sympodiomycopsis kandeliae]